MKFIRDCMEIVLNVCKTRNNNGKRRDGRNVKAKKVLRKLYFLDENGVFHTKRVTWLQGIKYRMKKVKRVYK